METSRYLEKHQLFPFQVQQPPEPGLALVVVIPCFDEPDLINTLRSLSDCELPRFPVEVLVVINGSETAPEPVRERNDATARAFDEWLAVAPQTPGLRFFRLDHTHLPPRHAGVGLARKAGMDEAVGRLARSPGVDGILLCLDADCRVQPNYLVEVASHFTAHPGSDAASIYYEHPLGGIDDGEAIARYELHLRYYVWGLRYAGLPYAHQTVGSSMAVRASAYCRQGGMNRRKAGEDFYFLMKFSEGLSEITRTCVTPSPRVSHRVPFGTGKAMADAQTQTFHTYDPEVFEELKVLTSRIPAWHAADPHGSEILAALPARLEAFLRAQEFPQVLSEIQANTTDEASFRKRFLRWFNAFRALKFVHYATEHGLPRMEVHPAAATLWKRLGPGNGAPEGSVRGLLEAYRRLDRDSS